MLCVAKALVPEDGAARVTLTKELVEYSQESARDKAP